MTMEFRGKLDSESGMESGIWWVAKIDLVDDEHLSLSFVRSDFDGIEEDMSRAKLERLVRRNINNPDFFSDEMFGGVFERVPQDDFDIIADMLDEAGVMATY